MNWQGIGNRWPGRATAVALLIKRGSSVIELGAGAQPLRRALRKPYRYAAADLYPRRGVLFMDMDRDIWPTGHWDVATMLGVLEYAEDPGRVLASVRLLADEAFVTYDHDDMVTVAFANRLTPDEFRDLALRDWSEARLVGWWHLTRSQRQAIWRLT